MKRMILFALAAGAVVALGQLTAAQWHAIGAALLALLVAYRVSLLPWLLALFFALLWLRQRDMTEAFRSGYLDKVVNPGRKRARR